MHIPADKVVRCKDRVYLHIDQRPMPVLVYSSSRLHDRLYHMLTAMHP